MYSDSGFSSPAEFSLPCRLLLTANAGIILELDGRRLLIDALHNTEHPHWSALTPEMTESVFSFLEPAPPDAILCTHIHPDHYSAGLLERAAAAFPNAALIEPYRSGDASGEFRLSDALNIRWFSLPHMHTDAPFDPPNYGFLIEYRGKQIFTPGDADFSTEEIHALFSRLSREAAGEPLPETASVGHDRKGIDLALLNFPWITLKRGREALALLSPKQLALFHLPFADKDPLGYIPSTLHAAERFRPDAAVLCRFLQEVSFSL